MQAIIAGAGYSGHAGLPLQAQFTDTLLAARELKSRQPSKVLVEYLEDFVSHTFGHTRVDGCFLARIGGLVHMRGSIGE
jgi:hypothetical protein